jgi:PcfJ-like protein
MDGRAPNRVAKSRMKAVDARQDLSQVQETAAGRRRRRLESFHPCYRRYIAELTCCASEVEDLADSFPGLLFALVSRYATVEQRQRAFDLVCTGEPLRQAADALGLAWWLRRLPAHAFTEPLPAFPVDGDFSLHIANLIPREDSLVPAWLARVSQAVEAGDLPYALWIARQRDLAGPPEDLFAFMAAWAWFSGRPGLLGHRLLRRPWTPQMSFKRAREELAAWRQRLRLIECLGPGIESPWLADGKAAGFDFVALRTVEDFVAESEALENCLDQYADQLHTGLTAVFSIRKGARRVACVEIGLHDEEVSMPNIVQLRAARNRRAPPEIWQATYSWIGGQRLMPLSPLRHAPKPMQRIEARRQLWNPYLEVLEGTRHAGPFRRMVFQQMRAPGLEPRRTRLPPLRLAATRHTGPHAPVREPT